MGNNAQTITQVIQNLRALFQKKDRLVGIDDWDNFLGCIIALEGVVSDLQTAAQAEEENPEEEGE